MRTLPPRGYKPGKALILLTAVALIVFAVTRSPAPDHFHAARDLQAELQQTRTERDAFMAIKDELNQARAEWELLSKEKGRLETIVPLKKELPFLLVELEKTINRHPLHLNHLRTGEKKRHHAYGTILIELGLSGQPAELERFLNRLVNQPHYTAYDSITWNYAPDNEVEVEIGLELYYIDPAGIEPLIDRPEFEYCPSAGALTWQQEDAGF